MVETEVKRSRFLAYLLPYNAFESERERLKAEHSKASHIAYAWRHINKYQQCMENFSDDGEPRGCAGQPILGALRGVELVESALLVVRYFGGIRLGTGGMVRAYGRAARSVIEAAELHPWLPRETLEFYSDYTPQRQIRYLLERLEIPSPECRYGEKGILWKIYAPTWILKRFREEAGRTIRLREEDGNAGGES